MGAHHDSLSRTISVGAKVMMCEHATQASKQLNSVTREAPTEHLYMALC
jgi:hypothetical protein